MRRSRWILRSATALLGAALALVAVVGVAHTPWGRPLFRYIPGMGVQCPAGAVDPAVIATARAAMLAPLRGTDVAASRRVSGLELSASRRDDVLAWAAGEGLTCEGMRHASLLRCTGIDLPGTRRSGTLHVRFDPLGRVLDVERSIRLAEVDDAVRMARVLADEIECSAGPVTSRRGETTAEHLGRGPLSQSAVEFRFADMRAQVIATNVGGGEFTVRELRQAIGE